MKRHIGRKSGETVRNRIRWLGKGLLHHAAGVRRKFLASVLLISAAAGASMSCAAPVYAVRAKSASSAHTLVVAASRQGAYPTIQAAVDAARNGDTIRILPGVYHEAVDMKNKTLYLDGVSRDACILTWSGRDYSEPPLEISTGTVSNLTIHATADGTPGLVPGGYCLHADFDPELGGTLVIDNVNFINDVTTAVGIATRAHFTAEIRNCLIETLGDAPAFFTHDWETGGAAVDTAGQVLSVENCVIRSSSSDTAAFTIHSQEVSAGAAEIRLIGNTVENTAAGGQTLALYRFSGRCLYPVGYLGGSDFLLSTDSSGNSEPQMNYATYRQPSGPAAATPLFLPTPETAAAAAGRQQ
ncbi:MAG: hypothetical protein SPL56_10340 [Lachnospiraceae bacterium]|nr:hypothetical protein [Lachnospiraceae bacterium]